MGKLHPKLKLRLRTRAKTHPVETDYERMSQGLDLLYEYVAFL